MRAGGRVAVVGGGISGLATAYFLTHGDPAARASGRGEGSRSAAHPSQPAAAMSRQPAAEAAERVPPPQVTVLEADTRWGGKIRTAEVGGFAVDTGPDAILVRSSVVENFLRSLRLLERLDRPASRRAYVWARGDLRPLPSSSLFGVPDSPLPLLRSRVLSPWGALRAGADFVLPRRALPADPTIAELLRPRFGREVFDHLVEPMLGGVHAGRAEALSARSAVPDVYRAARASRSTYLALRRREAPAGRGLGMVTVRGGLSRMVAALTEQLTAAGAELRSGAAVTAIEPVDDGFRLLVQGAEPVTVDAVVLATPAFVTGPLLAPLSSAAATALAGIPYVGVATLTLTYPRSAVRHGLDGTGFLVPPKGGRLLVGCTWSTVKWPSLADPTTAIFRCSVGRYADQRWSALPDEEIVERVHAELSESVGLSTGPGQAHLQRWPMALPQYTVGHEHRLAAVATALRPLPGLHVTGAAYRGVGIASCVAQAADAAAAVVTGLTGGPRGARGGPVSGALGPVR